MLSSCCNYVCVMRCHRKEALLREIVKTENDVSIENKKTNWSYLQKVSRPVLRGPGGNCSEQDFTLLTLVNTR